MKKEKDIFSGATLQQMQTFVALAKYGKQAAAEAATGKSQSQVSRDLSAIEKSLGGVVLIDRKTSILTLAGERLFVYAEKTINGWEHLSEEIAGNGGGSGRVTVAMPQDIFDGVFVDLLKSLSERAPELDARTVIAGTKETEKLLRGSEVDVGITDQRPAARSLAVRPCLKGKLCFVANGVNGLLAGKKVVPKDIIKAPLLVPSRESTVRERVEMFLGKYLKGAKLIEYGGGIESALAAARKGLGIVAIVGFEKDGGLWLGMQKNGLAVRSASKKIEFLEYYVAVRKGMELSGAVQFFLREILRRW